MTRELALKLTTGIFSKDVELYGPIGTLSIWEALFPEDYGKGKRKGKRVTIDRTVTFADIVRNRKEKQ